MKCVICTGITGSERRDYLEELRHSMKETDRFQVEDPWLRTKKLHAHLDEKTILNINDEEKLAYFRPSYKETANVLAGLRKKRAVVVVAVPTHSIFIGRAPHFPRLKEAYA